MRALCGEKREELILQPQPLEPQLIENSILGVLRARLDAVNLSIDFVILIEEAAEVIIAHLQLMNTLAMLGELVD